MKTQASANNRSRSIYATQIKNDYARNGNLWAQCIRYPGNQRKQPSPGAAELSPSAFLWLFSKSFW